MRPPYSGLKRKGGDPTLIKRNNPVVLGRKFCTSCGRWRHTCDFRRCRNNHEGLHAWCGACSRAWSRERDARRTAEERERDREYQAIWWDAKARSMGIPRRQIQRVTVIDQVERVLLPREPLVQEMQRWLDADPYRTAGPGFEDTGHSLVLLAELAGVAERTLGRIFSGQSARVRLDVADKVCQAIGTPLALVYDYDEQVAA